MKPKTTQEKVMLPAVPMGGKLPTKPATPTKPAKKKAKGRKKFDFKSMVGKKKK